MFSKYCVGNILWAKRVIIFLIALLINLRGGGAVDASHVNPLACYYYRMIRNILQQEFNYNSPYWSNKETYAVEDGLEGLTEKQTKLASYWNAPFDKICLGMKVNGVTKWIMINYQASSLFNVIADGVFKSTAAGRNAWKSLIADSALQYHCNKEGFNLHAYAEFFFAMGTNAHVRIGLFGNNEHDCNSVDSFIGFGASFTTCFATYADITCGNVALCKDGSHYHADKWIPTFGYVLVQ